MNIRLTLLGLYLPPVLRFRKLQELCEVTADAFRVPPPKLVGLPFDAALAAYASFTREAARRSRERGDDHEARGRLFEGAHRLGDRLRRELNIGDTHDALRAARLLYRAIGVDFRSDSTGAVTIPRCFFSTYYPPDACALISALDQGLLAGLTAGGRFSFTHRITEGHPCCLATLRFGE